MSWKKNLGLFLVFNLLVTLVSPAWSVQAETTDSTVESVGSVVKQEGSQPDNSLETITDESNAVTEEVIAEEDAAESATNDSAINTSTEDSTGEVVTELDEEQSEEKMETEPGSVSTETTTPGPEETDNTNSESISEDTTNKDSNTTIEYPAANTAKENSNNGEESYEEDAEVTEEPADTVMTFEDANLTLLIKNQLGMNADDLLTKEKLLELTTLYVDETMGFGDIASLEGLQKATNLQYITLEQISVDNINPLVGLSKLEKVKLNRMRYLTDFSPLTYIDSLKVLEVGKINESFEIDNVLATLKQNGVEVVNFNDSEPFLLMPDKITESTAYVSWGSFNDEAYDGYKLYLDGSLVEQFIKETYRYQLTKLKPETTYKVKIEVVKAGVVLHSIEESFKTAKAPMGKLVTFDSKGLELVVKEELGLERELYESDMERLETLYVPGLYIGSLVGLEKATNLKQLSLFDNSLTDISILEGMKNLKILDLSGNPIQNFGPIKGLKNIGSLNLSHTGISDISFLLNYENLSFVSLFGNLSLSEDAKALEVIKALETKGVYVDTGIDEDLNVMIYTNYVNESKISLGWDYFSEFDMGWAEEFKLFVNDKEVALTEEEFLGTVLTGLTEKTLYTIQVKAYSEGKLIGRATLEVTTKGQPTGKVIEFQDKKLETAIKDQLGLERSVQESDMLSLEALELAELGIKSLSGLQYAVNLMAISLMGNQLEDIKPLESLTQLQMLDLSNNPVSNIVPLKNLVNIQLLSLSNTNVVDITSLQNMTGMIFLDLSFSKVRDFTPLKTLPTLQLLSVASSGLDSFEAIAQLGNLMFLDISDNNLTSFNGIENMTGLMALIASNNPINDFSSLQSSSLEELILSETGITNLDWIEQTPELLVLDISNNSITDINNLKKAQKLSYLGLASLQISNIDVLLELPELLYVELADNPNLDLSEGSAALAVIKELAARGAEVYLGPDLEFLFEQTTEDSLVFGWVYTGQEEITHYDVYLGGEVVATLGLGETFYEINNLDPETEYEVGIEAWMGEELINGLFTIMLTTPDDLLDFSSIEASSESIVLEWAYEGEEEIKSYSILVDGKEVDVVDAETHEYLLTELSPETSYTIQLKAFGAENLYVAKAVAEVETSATEDPTTPEPEKPTTPNDPNPDNGGGNGDGAREHGTKPEKDMGAAPVKEMDKTPVKPIVNKGNLPDTASNLYNTMLLGLILILVAGGTCSLSRRKTAK